MSEINDKTDKKDWKNKLFYGNKSKIWYNVIEKILKFFKRSDKDNETNIDEYEKVADATATAVDVVEEATTEVVIEENTGESEDIVEEESTEESGDEPKEEVVEEETTEETEEKAVEEETTEETEEEIVEEETTEKSEEEAVEEETTEESEEEAVEEETTEESVEEAVEEETTEESEDEAVEEETTEEFEEEAVEEETTEESEEEAVEEESTKEPEEETVEESTEESGDEPEEEAVEEETTEESEEEVVEEETTEESEDEVVEEESTEESEEEAVEEETTEESEEEVVEEETTEESEEGVVEKETTEESEDEAVEEETTEESEEAEEEVVEEETTEESEDEAVEEETTEESEDEVVEEETTEESEDEAVEEESTEESEEETVEEETTEESEDEIVEEEYIKSVYDDMVFINQAYINDKNKKAATRNKQTKKHTGGTSMGCDELRVRWMFVRLREKRLDLLKPILPPESVMLNVAMQRGRWDDYGISMTINATSAATPGHQMATFFKDFIVVVDAGANEVEYYGSGKIEGVIPFASIKEYEVVTEKISEDYENKYLVFTMKKDDQKFSFKLYEKRIYDENFNYPWDYTPKTNGREIKFYTDVVDKCMADAVDYGKKSMVVLKIMAEMNEGFHYDVFQNYVVDTEEHHWSYVLKFLRTMKENGNNEYGAIYDQFKEKQQASYDLAIENNKKIKEIALQMKQVQEEIEQLEEEIPNLGFFARNLKGEKLNRLEELDGMEPGLVRQQNELKAEIERSRNDIEVIKKQTLDLLYKEIVTQDEYEVVMLERFLEQNGHLTFDEIAILLDVFEWLEPEHTETEAKKCLVPLIKKDVIILEDERCYFKASLDADRLKQIENKRDSSIEQMFAESKAKIYDIVYHEVITRRVVRKQSLVQLLNEEMMSCIGCLSDAFNNQIIDELVQNQVMKDMNKVYVSLK